MSYPKNGKRRVRDQVRAASTNPKIESLEPRTLFATAPTGFTDSVVTNGLTSPTTMEFAPDGRLFIAEQAGSILVYKDGAVLPTPLVTFQNVDSHAERGLLGVTVDPNFATNHYVYAYYTSSLPQSHNELVRVTVTGDVADPASFVDLVDLPNINGAIWHMGGAIHFGPDGKLYVTVGDYQQPTKAQDLTVPLGKVLRFNADGTIPTDNPFYATTTGVNRAIWAYGLRNPFSSAFDPLSGKFFINNVGEDTWETIFEGRAGANYGWPVAEGPRTNPSFDQPAYLYNHNGGGACVIGGAFYDGVTQQFPASYANQYFFADYVNGWIKTLDPVTKAVKNFATGISFPVAVRVSPDGTLFALARGTSKERDNLADGLGQLEQIQYSPKAAPAITLAPKSQLASVGTAVTFVTSASGALPLTYQWRRNGKNISGATHATYKLASAAAADNGAQYDVVVTNAYGTATSTAATLSITTAQAPVLKIGLTPDATLYSAGDTFTAIASGTGANGAALPTSAYTWQVDFQHETHAHPFVPPTPGVLQVGFTIPRVGETSTDVWYRIYLTATDPATGLSTTTIREVFPRKGNITLNTNVTGLHLDLDGAPTPAPSTVAGVFGVTRSISAPLEQDLNGKEYVFDSWSDGGAAMHNINFPATNVVYTAKYHVEKITYVSDLKPTGTPTNGWGPYEKDMSNGQTAARDGKAITLNGVVYKKGLGVRANSEIIYNLNGGYDRFVSDVGVDDEVGSLGSLSFQVWLDGIKIFDSGKMTGNSPTQTVDVSVVGKKQLRLVVVQPSGVAGNHADWAGARLLSAVAV